MDSLSHVNNTQYFRWFEDVRMTYFEASGLFGHMTTHKVGPILARTQCRFIVPLTYPDTVHVGTRISDVGEDRFTMLYTVVSETRDVIAAEGEGRIVIFDYNLGHKTPIPPAIRDQMTRMEA
jgi:acyl-CoA thioester hydrolase